MTTMPAIVPSRTVPRFTLTVQELEECPPPRSARWAVLLATAMVGSFIAWAAVFPVTERAIGRGEIAPMGSVQPVQHAAGGTVAEVLVRAGDRVAAGQVLVRLDGRAAEAEAAAAQARETALALSAERLAAAAEGRLADLASAPGAGLSGIRDSQAAMAEATVRLRATQLTVVEEELRARKTAADGLVTQLQAAVASRDLAARELDVMAPLAERGLVRRNDFYQLKQSHLRHSAEVERLESEAQAARIGVAETAARRDELVARSSQTSLDELARVEADLAETRQIRAAAEARLQQLDITAPVAGIVKEVGPRGSGSVVEPGGLVAEIVPDGGGIHAMVDLPAEQVGGVHVGQTATVKVLTFDPTRFGGLTGRVESISAASFRRQDGSAYFKVRLSVDRTTVGDPALGLAVTPGMTVVAEIATGERSLLSWLGKPVRNALDGAFMER